MMERRPGTVRQPSREDGRHRPRREPAAAPEAGNIPAEAPSPPERVLVVDDDGVLRSALLALLEAHGYDALGGSDGRDALRTLQQEPVDVVLTDLRMPGVSGGELLRQVREAFPEVPVVAMTSFASVSQAVELTRAGAAHYLTKPLDTEELLATLRRVLEESRPSRQAARARREEGKHLQGVVGRSRVMQVIIRQITRVAPSLAPVLIVGETGSGKEVVARAIHRIGGREPFVAVNCGAIPASILDSELFGHVRGAFTGAARDRRGLFEEADGGTLFLDEIGELSLELQSKLLRVLQFGEYRRVGESKTRRAEVRLLAATHRDLAEAVRQGTFREDLLFRINVIQIAVPPLRERAADIPLLAERYLASVAAREGRGEMTMEPAALAALVAYAWPGNVRQLQNVIERAVVLEPGARIGLADLPAEIRSAAPLTTTHTFVGSDLTVAEIERLHILAVLERFGGNRTRAAEVLGLPRRTLYRRLEEYGFRAKPTAPGEDAPA